MNRAIRAAVSLFFLTFVLLNSALAKETPFPISDESAKTLESGEFLFSTEKCDFYYPMLLRKNALNISKMRTDNDKVWNTFANEDL